jgi:hypothetical protein
VSALGHYLEEEGIATVVISLIRPQTEKVKPPRALWVPFELGRPFGPPDETAFQRRVVLAALRLLERDDGPVLLEDFPDDDPRARPDPAWQPPLAPVAADGPAGALADRLEAEIAALEAAHDRFQTRHGHSTVGLSLLSPAECGRYIGMWLRGLTPDSPRDGFSAPLLLRFAVDDLKAYYLEAGAAGDARPSSRQLGDWFWNGTVGGAALYALRELGAASADDRVKTVTGNFIVPGARLRPAG